MFRFLERIGRAADYVLLSRSRARAEWLDGRNVVVGKLVRGHDLLPVISRRFGSISGVPKEELYIGSCGMDHSKI